jgi:hypothetical protein
VEFCGERFTRGGLGSRSCLCNGRFALRRCFDFDPSQFRRALFRSLRTNALELGRHLCGRFTLGGSFGLDARDFCRPLLGRFRADALDFGSHLRRGLALRRSLGLHARHFGSTLLGRLGTHALDFGRHPRVSLGLDQRNLCGMDFRIDAVLDRPVRGAPRSSELVD